LARQRFHDDAHRGVDRPSPARPASAHDDDDRPADDNDGPVDDNDRSVHGAAAHRDDGGPDRSADLSDNRAAHGAADGAADCGVVAAVGCAGFVDSDVRGRVQRFEFGPGEVEHDRDVGVL
jgi:hypothetical protein